MKDGGHLYFLRYLDAADAGPPDSRAQAAFVLAVLCRPGGRGQVSPACQKTILGWVVDLSHRAKCFLWSCVMQCLGVGLGVSIAFMSRHVFPT